MKMFRKFGSAAIVGVLVTTGTALPASAEEEAKEIVDLVQQAEEDTFDTDVNNVDVVEVSGGGFEATVVGEAVTVPESSDDPIEIETNEGTLEIDFPGTVSQDGDLVGDSVAYPDVESGLGIVVDPTESGVRVSAVIETAEAQHILDFDITVPDNGYLNLEDDGSVTIRDTDSEVIRLIAAPWASDANGESVETWYEVAGDVLTQHVDPTAVTAYPITADPEIKGPGIFSPWFTFKLNSAEARELKEAVKVGGAAAVVAAVLCAEETAGICGIVSIPLAVAVTALGVTILQSCENSKGLDIHVTLGPTGLPTTVWCSGY